MATTGSPSEFAVATPVSRFEQSGPEVTSATPDFPCHPANSSGDNSSVLLMPADYSLDLGIQQRVENFVDFCPGTPKMYSTPCASRLLTNTPAPVCADGITLFPGVLTFFLLLLSQERLMDRDASPL